MSNTIPVGLRKPWQWIQYSHLAEGGLGRVMWESDFKELLKDFPHLTQEKTK